MSQIESDTLSRLRAARNRWRERTRSASPSDLSLGIVATFTADALIPYLGSELLEASFTPSILSAPFNQPLQSLMLPEQAFGGSLPDYILFLTRLDDFASREIVEFLAGSENAWSELLRKIDEQAQAVCGFIESRKSTLLVGTFPFPSIPEADARDLEGGINDLFSRLARLWRDRLAEIPGVILIDCEALQRDFGVSRSLDSRKWLLYRQPYTEEFLFEVASQAARTIVATRRSSRKCAVIDCDNTLWGGIIGEDGLDGIKLGDEFPGSGFQAFQRLLLHWKKQGIFLAVCSQNNLEDVREVFRKHDGMILSESDVSVWSVDWRPKAQRLPEIAQKLNIGKDALVFFDDNPFEIAQVGEYHPEIICVTVPKESERIVSVARGIRAFDKLQITNDDRLRVNRYVAESTREELRQQLSIEDFICQLGLTVDTVLVDADNLTRVSQLINKTNQFNLTTPRMTVEEVRAVIDSPDHIIRAATVSDRFGEYGLTCVGIVERRPENWHLSTFLMSCRVLGRGVETSFLADLAQEVLAQGGERITAEFIPTPRNVVCSDFLNRHGFTCNPQGTWQQLAADLAQNRPAGRNSPA